MNYKKKHKLKILKKCLVLPPLAPIPFFHSNALEFWVRIIPLIPLWWVNDPNFVDYILGQMAALAIL